MWVCFGPAWPVAANTVLQWHSRRLLPCGDAPVAVV
jgi:hypothetical protein